MKLNKKIETEIWKVYNTWLNSYLNGNVKTYNKYLDKDYHFIGSTDNEEFLNKKDTTNFFKATADQLAGKCDLRNETRIIENFDGLVFITHLFDAWFKNGDDWSYYGRFRFSNALKNNKEGWRFIYQHFSTTDSKTDEGETIGFDKVSVENQELREAIKRRTFELEQKNRELEIETALEKVRSRTIAMQHSDELQEASFLLDQQVRALGIKTWGCAFNVYGEKESTEWFGNEAGTLHTYTVPRAGIFKDYYQKGQNGVSLYIKEFSGEACVAHYEYMSSLPVIGDVLKNLKKTNKGFPTYQIDHVVYFKYGYLLFITRESVPAAHDIFKRFAKVFEQTYTRFLDLQKAEAQTRDAQINLAVERVRAKALAMHKSEEIMEVVAKLKEEVMSLDIPDVIAATIFLNEGEDKVRMWDLSTLEKDNNGYQIPFDITFKLKKRDPNLYVKRVWENPENYFLEKQEAKDFKRIVAWLRENNQVKIANEVEEYTKSIKLERLHHAVKKLNNGKLVIDLLNPPSEEMEIILTKMGAAFDLAYKRFEDLQKAEAQTKEAQIEAALEKVRSSSLAVHKIDEFNKVVKVIFERLDELNIPAYSVTMMVPKVDTKDWDVFGCGVSNSGLVTMKFQLPYFPSVMMDDLKQLDSQSEASYSTKIYTEAEKNQYYEYVFNNTELKNLPDDIKQQVWQSTSYAVSIASAKNSMIVVNDFEGHILDASQAEILKRFSKVFEQAYIRFMDLQKAEAQAREAQIEVALERVRSRTMAMHNSDELGEVAAVLFEQVSLLTDTPNRFNIGIINESKKTFDIWVTDQEGKNINNLFVAEVNKSPIIKKIFEAWKADDKRIIQILKGKQLENWVAYMSDEVGVPFDKKRISKQRYINSIFFKQGFMGITTSEPIEENTLMLLERFTAVFQQTYTRFLDLQKAEAQAREAQIETALEKIRSRSLAMQKSDELLDLIGILSEQASSLGLKFDSILFGKNDKEGVFNFWMTSKGQPKPILMDVPYVINKVQQRVIKAQKEGRKFLADVVTGKSYKEWNNHILTNTPLQFFPKAVKTYLTKAPGFARSSFFLKEIALYVMNYKVEPFSDADNAIFNRFAQVFDQSYTRFLDLQKAEKQARESQIEAALEKVRSRSLAMHKPDELQEVVAVVAEKLQELGVIFDAGGVILCTYFPDNKDVVHWIAVDDFSTSGRYFVPYFDNPIFREAWDSKIRDDAYFSKEFSVEAKNHFFEYAFEHSDYKHMSEDYKQYVLKADQHNLSAAWSKNSAIIIPSLTGAVPSESDAEIIKRFAKVFEQAYIRFMDLQKAEERARETQIDIALERVRSRTLAMQTSEELAETSMVVFQQLVELGIAPNRLFIGIIKDKGTSIEAWATNEDGSKIASQFTLQASKNKSIKKMITGWKEDKKSLVIDMKGKELQDYFQYLNKDLKIPFMDGLKQKRRVQTLAYFSGGLIGMAAPDEQSEDSLRLLERFASVFNLTYTRFNDLKVAEANAIQAKKDLILLQTEKKKAEDALSELKTTQAQLIQSEKMASLGELTAGIAHEIQNPLNFVNNFSEVSNELIDEMNEEMDKGDLEEAKFIAKDIKQNLEKINHHGKRADAIVKGMLQHSRTNSAEKEPTDINKLADEYLRLAYHGLRAKDKSFNATLKTDYEESIGKIPVIPQDMGRVILNLITNAFYACNEKKKSGSDNYEPTVTVSTKKQKDNITISVKDNGNGIPKDVVDKIFQPFFTTKPTGQGTGLGLSMSYDIITKGHGGELTVETKEGEGLPTGQAGTTFNIELPI